MRRRARTDANHSQIAERFRAHGYEVVDTSRLGEGFPDLLVARAGRLTQVEVKDGSKPPSARKLTPDEQVYHAKMHAAGCPVVVIEREETVDLMAAWAR